MTATSHLEREDAKIKRCLCCGAWVYEGRPCATGCEEPS